MTTKACDLCNTDFECKGINGCWCRSIKISKTELKLLRTQASDCICPRCLTNLAKSGTEILNR